MHELINGTYRWRTDRIRPSFFSTRPLYVAIIGIFPHLKNVDTSVHSFEINLFTVSSLKHDGTEIGNPNKTTKWKTKVLFDSEAKGLHRL